MTSRPDDDETPIERGDAPDAADVPPADPSGRVDGEDLDQGPEPEATESPMGDTRDQSAP
jgi:hypothetical protein